MFACSYVRMFACSCRIPASPLEAVLNRRILAWSGKRTLCRRSVKKRGRFACKPAKAPVLAMPNNVPAKATCGWFGYLLPPKVPIKSNYLTDSISKSRGNDLSTLKAVSFVFHFDLSKTLWQRYEIADKKANEKNCLICFSLIGHSSYRWL